MTPDQKVRGEIMRYEGGSVGHRLHPGFLARGEPVGECSNAEHRKRSSRRLMLAALAKVNEIKKLLLAI